MRTSERLHELACWINDRALHWARTNGGYPLSCARTIPGWLLVASVREDGSDMDIEAIPTSLAVRWHRQATAWLRETDYALHLQRDDEETCDELVADALSETEPSQEEIHEAISKRSREKSTEENHE